MLNGRQYRDEITPDHSVRKEIEELTRVYRSGRDNMDFHHTYYSISGLAYTKGLDSFDEVMPESRVLNLFNACIETKGFSWVESRFINWVICIAGRELRNRGDFEPHPECMVNCTYRMPYETPCLQKNALRVEIFSPADRCGWKLKDGHIGGVPNDYHPCNYGGNA